MERLAFGIYLLVVVISPLLFGAVHAYAYSLIFLLILVASLLLAATNIRRDENSNSIYFQYPVTGLNFLFFSVFAFLTLQILPLPSFMVESLTPQGFAVQARAAALAGSQEVKSLAPYVYPVRLSLVRWTVYGLFFLGLSQVLNSRRRMDILCLCILITAGFISVYGIYQAYAGDNRIWWYAGYGGDVRGTYINRNHFAGLMAMALMLAAAYASSLSNRFMGRKSGPPDTRDEILRYLSAEQLYSKRALVVFCGAVIGLGLVLSASRGGIISAALGLMLLGFFYVFRQSQRRNGLIVLVIFMLVGGYGLKVGLEHTIARFQADQLQSSFEGRFRYASKTMDVFRDYKAVGVGVGNFQEAYPRYQASEDMGLLIDYAHNDWAQLLAETGTAGFILTISGIVFFVIFILRRWRGRKDPRSLALGIVPLAALTSMGVHSWSDFNMHIPANVLILGAIIALGQASLAIRRKKTGWKFELGFNRLYFKTGGVLVAAALFLVIIWSMSWTVRHFTAELFCNTVPNSTMNRVRNPPAAKVSRAISWDRHNAEYWFKLAQARRIENAGQKNYLDDMTAALEKAVALNPFAALYYLELGWAHTRRWREPDFTETWLHKADQAMDLAGLYSGARDPRLHNDVGNYWLMRSKTFAREAAPWDRALEKAGAHYRQALALVKGKKQDDLLEDISRTVWNYYPDPEILEKLVGS